MKGARIAWREGLALMPQHLILAERLVGDAMNGDAMNRDARHCVSTGAPFGYARLVLDEALVGNGTLSVVACSALFPDGTVWTQGEYGVQALGRSFAEGFGIEKSALMAYLAFRNEQEVEFEFEGLRIPLLVPAPVILFEGEAQDGFSVLPLARILRTAQGGLALDANFCPPLSGAEAYPPFLGKLESVYRQLGSQVPFAPLWWLYADLAGRIGGSAETQVPAPLQYTRFNECWNGLFAAVRDALASRLRPKCLRALMEREGDAFFFADLPPEFLGRTVYLVLESELTAEEILRLFPVQSKVAPRERLRALMVSALQGLPCRASLAPPASLGLRGEPVAQILEALTTQGLGVYAPPHLKLKRIEVRTEA
jgi:predicted component of type VI protein secretion system